MELKVKFRKEVLQILKSRVGVRDKILDKKINREIIKYLKESKVKSIFGYIPLKTEVNIKEVFNFCRVNKIDVYVPFMEGKSFRLVKYRLPFRKKRFGIKEPKFSQQYKARSIDLAIIPILGIDKNLKRVGFGKGMYDRFFEKKSINIKKVMFLQRIIFFTNVEITNQFDIRADEIMGRGFKIVKV